MSQDKRNVIRISWIVSAIVLGFAASCASTVANAQSVGGGDETVGTPSNASTLPKILRGVGFDQRIGSQIPLDATFTDETGKAVPLRTYFGNVPVVLILAYYRCPMLCSQVMSGATAAFKKVGFRIGDQFNVLTVSFDPTDTPDAAATTKQIYMEQYGDPKAVAGWHFRLCAGIRKTAAFCWVSIDEAIHAPRLEHDGWPLSPCLLGFSQRFWESIVASGS